MKARFFMAAVIVLASTAAFADPVLPKVAILNLNGGTFKVIYQGKETGPVRMTITNRSNDVVFTESTHNLSGFVRNVNFEGMTPGEYTIEIADKAGKSVQKIVYGKQSSVKAIRVTRLGGEPKYLLAVAHTGAEQLNVRIFDGADNLVHNEVRNIEGDFGIVFNLAGVSGTPSFEVTDGTGAVRRIK
ncbi:MAG TPA: hypothetical protein VG737_02910 [Cyclobacteriaceae bacterium]|nr:hypothetical protein [Cyclobacteriaceae bacterium]